MGTNSDKQFLDLVNQDNALALTTKDVIFGTVDEIEARDVTRIKAAPDSGYRGGVTLRYNRLKLGKLFGFFQPKVLVPDSTEPSPELLLALIAECYGLVIDLEDVVVLRKTIPEGDFYIVEAKDTSLVYSGATEIMLTFNQLEISTVIDSESESYVYPTPTVEPEKVDGLVYSGGWYIPEASIELSAFVAGNSADKNLAWLTQTLSGDDWVFQEAVPHPRNLAGGVVLFNGPENEYELVDASVVSLLNPQGETPRNVLIVQLDDTLCEFLTGSLTFYY